MRVGVGADYAGRHPYYFSAQLPPSHHSRPRYGTNHCCKVFFCSSDNMGFCSCTIKYLLFFFNFIVVLCGIAIIAIGVLVSKNSQALHDVLDLKISAPSIALIVVGVIIFVIAFFGCCGAVRDSSCMMTTYAIFLMTILVIEVAIAVFAFVYKKEFESTYRKGLSDIFSSYENNKETVDAIQIDFQCCGFDGPSSWSGTPPPSCCRNKDDGPKCSTWDTGCSENVANGLRIMFTQLAGVAIAVACIEVLGVVFSLCLASSIRRKEIRGYV